MPSSRPSIDYLRQELERIQRKARRLSGARLLTFAAGVALTVLALSEQHAGYAVGALVLGVAFIVAVSAHAGCLARRAIVSDRLTLATESEERRRSRKGRSEAPEPDPALERHARAASLEDGADPVSPLDESVIEDLQLLRGPRNLFGLLDVTSTRFGSERLRHALLHPRLEVEAIRQRQKSVSSLGGDEDSVGRSWRSSPVSASTRASRWRARSRSPFPSPERRPCACWLTSSDSPRPWLSAWPSSTRAPGP